MRVAHTHARTHAEGAKWCETVPVGSRRMSSRCGARDVLSAAGRRSPLRHTKHVFALSLVVVRYAASCTFHVHTHTNTREPRAHRFPEGVVMLGRYSRMASRWVDWGVVLSTTVLELYVCLCVCLLIRIMCVHCTAVSGTRYGRYGLFIKRGRRRRCC